jgi:hypothetical protein
MSNHKDARRSENSGAVALKEPKDVAMLILAL